MGEAIRALVSNDSAQISAELIIVAAALIAVALILITQLQASAGRGAAKLKEATQQTEAAIEEIIKSTK